VRRDESSDLRDTLADATVLVTGGSRGIGRAISLACGRAGADVIVASRRPSDVDALRDELREHGSELLAIPADLADATQLARLAEEAWAWRGRVDALVNCAGMLVRQDVLETTPEAWDDTFTLNVRAAFFLSQALGRRMIEAGGGAIVNVASVAAEVTTRAPVAYSVSKAALVHLTRVLAVNFAPAVRVNAVGPAYIRTDINAAWLEQPANRDFVLERTPLGRVGAPADVAGAVVFLASGQAGYVTGQHLLVDGGWTAQ
jgi:NAD(P)-dependent dehydrogenase (short-subunit alcohol dehydrogenase family)